MSKNSVAIDFAAVNILLSFIMLIMSTMLCLMGSSCVSIAEISGSETLVHFKLKENEWVSQSHGVHNFNLGETTKFYIDTSKCLYFNNQGAFING